VQYQVERISYCAFGTLGTAKIDEESVWTPYYKS
jgi:hypothetical protein